MKKKITIHYDNLANYEQPLLLWREVDSDKLNSVTASGQDEYGTIYKLKVDARQKILFKFADKASNAYEADDLYRQLDGKNVKPLSELWCRSWHEFIHTKEPQTVSSVSADERVQCDYVQGIYISDTGGRFALGSNSMRDGGVLFSTFHPHARAIYVVGDFNDWQHPEAKNADPNKFIPMTLHRGYFGTPNIWVADVPQAQVGQNYKYYVAYDTYLSEGDLSNRLMVDPYARYIGKDYSSNNSVIIDTTTYTWHDAEYHTPLMHDLIIYELHVHGFTQGDEDIDPNHQGTYQGIIDRIEMGYFDRLGITCLYLMPISEVPTPQGEDALGYNSSLFIAIERDFGSPDDLRRLVDVAHQHGMAVIIDQVFNHSANSWNPLWKYILDHPDEVNNGSEGGLYFSGETPWGNRISTERTETQNMLIDACKLMITEYHVDGFRFDATHTNYMSHDLLHRLADEVQHIKKDVILIAENLPNQQDLNRDGYNGFAQWNDFFHDGIKAFLRETKFEGTDDTPENLGQIFYFAKGQFAAHTNNVINYCESHDEHSVAYEVQFVENLNSPAAQERKARLGLFSTMVALGQPMIYMGQELGLVRERNKVSFDFPQNYENHGFYRWSCGLMSLRNRYPALRLHGFSPIDEGEFQWLLGAWLDTRHGGGKRVVGWRSIPTTDKHDVMVILINFENHAVEVDIPFGLDGQWVRLASIDDNNSGDHSLTVTVRDGILPNFVLPDSSGFIYKWEAEL